MNTILSSLTSLTIAFFALANESACNTTPAQTTPRHAHPELVYADQLDGTYCDASTLCLTVSATSQVYLWTASDCYETGQLSGALEFDPNPHSLQHTPGGLCFAQDNDPSLYSAEVHRTPRGLWLAIDNQERPIELTYIGSAKH